MVNDLLYFDEKGRVYCKNNAKNDLEITNGYGLVDISYPKSKERRGRVQGGGKLCPTLTRTNSIIKVIKEEED